MICIVCGNEIGETIYCPMCGAEVDAKQKERSCFHQRGNADATTVLCVNKEGKREEKESEKQEKYVVLEEVDIQKKSCKKRIIMWITIAVVLIMAGIITFYYYFK